MTIKTKAHTWFNFASLQGKKSNFTKQFTFGDKEIFLQVSLNDDGTCQSLATDIKNDSHTRSILYNTIMAVNIGLENGVGLEHYCNDFIKGETPSLCDVKITGDENIKSGKTVIGTIFRILATEFNIEIDNSILTMQQRQKVRNMFFPPTDP